MTHSGAVLHICKYNIKQFRERVIESQKESQRVSQRDIQKDPERARERVIESQKESQREPGERRIFKLPVPNLICSKT